MDNNVVANLVKNTDLKLSKSIEAFEKDLITIRTGRASAAILDNIKIDYYGSSNSIEQLATVSIPEPRTILITVWDKAAVNLIEAAIIGANLGINPVVDGTKIKLPIPPLNEERRKELVKRSAEYAEKTKVAIRQIRKHFLDELKELQKNKEISEDDFKLESEHFEKKVKKTNDKIEEVLAKKSKDIMQI